MQSSWHGSGWIQLKNQNGNFSWQSNHKREDSNVILQDDPMTSNHLQAVKLGILNSNQVDQQKQMFLQVPPT